MSKLIPTETATRWQRVVPMAIAAFCAAAAVPSYADDPEEPVVEPDVWAEITRDDIPADVTTRLGALIPFDAVSYIHENLVLHFDGIRNAGLTAPHATETTKWKNLVPGQTDATIKTRDGSAIAGYWEKTGFRFNPDSRPDFQDYAALDSAIDVGRDFTFQITTDIDLSKQSTSKTGGRYPSYFNTEDGSNANGMWTDNNGKTTTLLRGCFDHYLDANFSSGSNLSGKRIDIPVWEGKYATLMLSHEGYGWFFQTADPTLPEGATCVVTKGPGAKQYTWSGASTGAKIPIRGVYHAVRVYTNVLTAAQIQWNRMLDEVRFRGVEPNANVVVESNVAGVEATEAGKYMVSGHHVFTAPASVTANGCTYAPTGYTLEVWDTAANRWSAAEVHDGETSFAYTNCIARTKVRLIWNWTLQSGVKKYDADSYVQGGLLLNYDGIRNAGIDAPHSTNTTTWANLGSLGSSRDAVRGSVSGNAQGEWSQKGFDFKGANYFTAGGTADFGQYITAQVVTDSSPMWRNTYKRRWPSPIGCTASDNTFLIYGNSYGYLNNKYHFQSAHTSGKTVEVVPWNGRFFNVVVSTNTISLSDGEITGSNTAGTFGYNSDGLTMVIGSSKADDNYVARCFAGRIYSARWYNRVLTAAEIKYNNDIDWCRFFGATGRSGETDLVEVRSERPEIELEDAGVYIVRGSGSALSVSAPATTNIGGKVYACAGYRVETWDATAKTWGSPVETAGTTCELTGTTGGANRRVTWRWTLTQGVRTAADYDVADYVQTGLVGHFDGIRNEGADMPSSNVKEALWRNLVTDDPDATITSSGGSWTNGVGFYFTGAATGEYAKMKDPVSLGSNSTVQVACDVDYSVQSSGSGWYPATFSDDSNNYCIFFRNTTAGTLSTGLEMNADNYGTKSNRPMMNPWGGKYLTAVLGTGHSWMFEGTAFENQKTRGNYSVYTKCYAWGGCPKSGFNPGLKGEIDSVRLYNRVLTEAELVQNRKVDEIRFRGNFADYANLIVVNGSSIEGAETSLPAGEYELTGSLTITAADVRADGRLYRSKVCVETWDGSAWVAGGKQSGSSYTATDAARVRLTYTWERSGFMLIIR